MELFQLINSIQEIKNQRSDETQKKVDSIENQEDVKLIRECLTAFGRLNCAKKVDLCSDSLIITFWLNEPLYVIQDTFKMFDNRIVSHNVNILNDFRMIIHLTQNGLDVYKAWKDVPESAF